MNTDDLDIQIKSIEKDIQNLQKRLVQLRKQRYKLAKKDVTDPIKAFNIWVESGTASKDEPYIVHIKSTSGKELDLELQRHERMDLDCLAEILNYRIEDLGDNDFVNHKEYKFINDIWTAVDTGKLDYTRQDVLDWMKWLQDHDLNSFVYDW